MITELDYRILLNILFHTETQYNTEDDCDARELLEKRFIILLLEYFGVKLSINVLV